MMGPTVRPESTPTMTQRPTQRYTGTRGLVWLLLVAVTLMGLAVTRQQALGPLHTHAELGAGGTSAISAAVSSLATDWRSRWRQQQAFGHTQLRLVAVSDEMALWPPSDSRTGAHSAHIHDHGALERHHHAVEDASVVAVDGAAHAADAADGLAAGAANLLPAVATLSDGLALLALVTRGGPWPIDSAAAFVSRSIAPLLRPPTA